MLYVNFFPGGALLETDPQDTSMPIHVSEKAAAFIEPMLTCPDTSAALAALFLAGAQAGERAAAGSFLKATERTDATPST